MVGVGGMQAMGFSIICGQKTGMDGVMGYQANEKGFIIKGLTSPLKHVTVKRANQRMRS